MDRELDLDRAFEIANDPFAVNDLDDLREARALVASVMEARDIPADEWLTTISEIDIRIAQLEARRRERNERARIRRREITEAYRSLGLKRVRGNLGGTYWE